MLPYIGWLSIVFFGAVLLALIWRMRSNEVAVRIGPDGIFWKGFSKNWIPWDEIAAIGVLEVRKQRMVGIKLRDGSSARSERWGKSGAFLNEKLSGYPICISVTGTDRSFSELLGALQQFGRRNSGDTSPEFQGPLT